MKEKKELLHKKISRKSRHYSYYLKAPLSQVDQDTHHIIQLEKARQIEKIILIPSESICPGPVQEALSSPFGNLYAEGYPSRRMSEENNEELLLDFDHQLSHYRRYSDRRFYKGVEFADFIESLAQRRVANLFATDKISADKIFANVQPLSGAAANNCVYAAFLKPGDTIMGMSLSHGGHLTHGSEFNRSGKYYQVIPYEAEPAGGKLNYDAIKELALRHRPKIIIAGYSAYPWSVDWKKFREITDATGALLFADIAHVAGLIVAGVYPNPVGFADVITFTTHKTLCGPRGAVILTTDEEKANLIDNAVFPGEQGGPHINKMAAMAVAFKIAKTEEFRKLQEKIVENAKVLSSSLAKRGLKIAYGGTDTHLLLVDLNAIETKTGFPLKGEIAARILDICDIVVNKNTIPKDESAAEASGIRLGTPWVTQRGFEKKDMEKIAELIHKVLVNIYPFTYRGMTRDLPRGKIKLDVVEKVKDELKELIQKKERGVQKGKKVFDLAFSGKASGTVEKLHEGNMGLLKITGERAKAFLQEVLTANIADLKVGDTISSFLLDAEGRLIDDVSILHLPSDDKGRACYLLSTTLSQTQKVKFWLEALSDGYIIFDPQDIFAKIQGPVVVENLTERKKEILQRLKKSLKVNLKDFKYKECSRLNENLPSAEEEKQQIEGLYLYKKFPSCFDLSKPYFVGQKLFIQNGVSSGAKKEEFFYREEEKVKKSFLHNEHLKLGAKFTRFSGWEMPLYYTSIGEEHRAVRQTAGLFDVSHMGLLEVRGEDAADFLDTVCTNYIRWIRAGQCQYSFLLDPDGNVIDDIMVYCQEKDRYLIVCNAANQGKVFAWFEAVNSKGYLIDKDYPVREVKDGVEIKSLKDTSAGKMQKIDIAFQGPLSILILRKFVDDEKIKDKIQRLQKNEFIEGKIAGKDMIISRTGYTGEDTGYELYLHPEDAPFIWDLILKKGKEFKVKPCGLGARDSTRIEAGLPLYGHELAGKYKINPIEAGYGAFVKFHKAFFVGREALLKKEKKREKKIIRFKLKSSYGRMVREDDVVVDKRGRYVGKVTSCALTGDSQVGLAYVDEKIQEGEEIAIFPLSRGRFEEKPVGDLEEGDRTSLPQKAIILPRFPQ
ncbi:glycine cleavage system aminomethyltransferase GcvT [Candidatus Aerophobetes bacterium]|nr:glycine cleavage system aminomethyltransferase GcvT [Candidatus Aerophobetes bacterium]